MESKGNSREIKSSLQNEESRSGISDDDSSSRLDFEVVNMVTACGRNRGSGRYSDPKYLCQICEDVAVGYHCGAFICEACKKFYLRCIKSGAQSSFTCAKNQNCEIKKDTRSHCQFCRFQKCVQLGMYKSGQIYVKIILCLICLLSL